MITELSPEVIVEVNKHFPASDVSAALAVLKAAHLPLLELKERSLDRARVHMAAIKWSHGNVKQFRLAVELASTDWRDLLVAAGLANADWQAVLVKDGFLVPRAA